MSGPQGSFEPAQRAAQPIDEHVRIGHVHLRTADIGRVRRFYVDILGFDVIFEARGAPGWGTTGDILFISAGGYHHHLGFNTWLSADGEPPERGHTGLHHVALNFSSKARLAQAVHRLVDAGVELRQLTDHGTHLAVYLSDPDGNDLELAWDRPAEQWPRYGAGGVEFLDAPLHLDELLAAAR
jgi:catechol 2,3-dioxygenase